MPINANTLPSVKNPNFGNVTAKTKDYSINYFYFRFIKAQVQSGNLFPAKIMREMNFPTTFTPSRRIIGTSP